MKEILKNIAKGIGLFFILILLYCLLLTFSYGLPNNKIRKNLIASVSTITDEGGFYFRPFFGENNTLSESYTLDNYTDSIILAIAFDKGENQGINILDRVVSNYKYENKEDKGPVVSLQESIDENNTTNSTYIRYWFGIEAFIRPLLLVCTYQMIRYMNVIFLIMLLTIACTLISKKLNTKYMFAFIMSLLLMGLLIIPMSLQYMPVMTIMLLTVITLLLLSKSEKFDKILPFIFLIAGSTTAFMDLLTYPLVTLGIPLVITFLIKQKKEEINVKNSILLIIKLSVIWALAYGGTYFLKWVIASIILKQNIIVESMNQFLMRADINSTEKFDKLKVIKLNFGVYFNKFVLILLAIYFIVWIILMFKHRNKNVKIKQILPFLIISILPYMWYIALTNHSGIHYWMTYRIQAITMFSLICASLKMLDFEEKVEGKAEEKTEK